MIRNIIKGRKGIAVFGLVALCVLFLVILHSCSGESKSQANNTLLEGSYWKCPINDNNTLYWSFAKNDGIASVRVNNEPLDFHVEIYGKDQSQFSDDKDIDSVYGIKLSLPLAQKNVFDGVFIIYKNSNYAALGKVGGEILKDINKMIRCSREEAEALKGGDNFGPFALSNAWLSSDKKDGIFIFNEDVVYGGMVYRLNRYYIDSSPGKLVFEDDDGENILELNYSAKEMHINDQGRKITLYPNRNKSDLDDHVIHLRSLERR